MAGDELTAAPTTDQQPDTAEQQPVTLDLSKSQKLDAPQGPAQGVTLDMSKSQPVSVAGPPATSIGPRREADNVSSNPLVSLVGGIAHPQANMSAFHNWIEDLRGDVRNGTDATWIGSMLRKMGAKGTGYGVSSGVSEFMGGPIEGIPKLLEAAPLAKEGHLTQAANAAIGGTFQSLGPAAMLSPEALPIVVPSMVAANIATKTAKHMGADDDTAELVGNVTAVMVGAKVHSKLEVENFQNATNSSINAQKVYQTRAGELDIARQQAEVARQRAIDTAKDEWNKVNGNDAAPLTDEQKQELRQRTDGARTVASEAAKNAENAQQAFDVSNQSRAEASLRLRQFSRKIQEKAATAAQDEASKVSKNQQTNRELMQKAIPAKNSDLYTADENGNYPKYDIVRSHLEAAKERGLPVDTIADARNAAEDSRQRIDDTIAEKSDPIKDEPLVLNPQEESPIVSATKKLDEMARVDGNFKDAASYLSDFNTADLTVNEGKELITKLNDYQRAMKKSSNNWDVYNQIETNPKFAAFWFLADSLREKWYDRLESAGINGVADARKESAALIDFRNSADAQLRRNAGGTSVRGSGSNAGPTRNLIAKLTGKVARGAGAAMGAEAGGPAGAVVGGALGDMLGEPIQDFISPADLTRDEHVAKSMKTQGTTRKPVDITGEARTANVPEVPQPPVPKAVEGPQNLELTPREDTDLHADLAAHYGLTDLNQRSYSDLENDLRRDLEDKKAAGVDADPTEQKLMARVFKADAADRATIKRANAEAAATAKKTAEQLKVEDQVAAEAIDRAGPTTTETKNTLELNPTLERLGRGDESALVSHSVAAKAHSPAMAIPGLPEGLSSESAHQHEWAHLALGAIDGLEPFDYISNMHPEAPNTSAARARFTVENLKDENGNVDPEKMLTQETQYLTKKMAGPASHEVFDNLTYDDIKKMSNTAGDFRTARRVIRELHPDFSPSQVEETMEAAYQRARNFLSNPDVANRIRANAAVREDGLDVTHHASAGRVHQFAEDLRKVVNGEDTNNDAGPDGGKSGEGSKKTESAGEEPEPVGKQPAKEKKNAGGDSNGREGSARPTAGEPANTRGGTGLNGEDQTIDEAKREFEELNKGSNVKTTRKTFTPTEKVESKPSVPPERSTGNVADDEAIRKGGAIPGGRMKGDPSIGLSDLSMFHDPESGTTLALKSAEGVTPEKVAEKLAASRAEYAKYKKPELTGEDQTATEPTVAEGADEYNRAVGRPQIDASVKPHSPEFGKRVADAFDQMKHDPTNPEVQKSYGAMADEVKKQWDYATEKMGMKFEPWTKEGQPYANSKEMMADVKDNKHLYFFQGGDVKSESPMAKVDPKSGLSYNDMFRAVHDLFGHAAHGFEFGPKGEENAYLVHRQMFPPEAIPAMTSETRGQNSWVNFGKHLRDEAGNIPKKGEEGFVPPAQRPYAEQKVGLLPSEFHQTGDWADRVHGNLNEQPAGGINPNNPEGQSKRYGLELLPEVRQMHDQLSPEAFREYAQRPEVKAALEAHPDVKLGWDTTGAKPELNVGISTNDLAKAKDVAGKLDQRDLWDNQESKTVPVGGKGEQTSFPNYSLKDRLNDLANEDQIKGSTVPLMKNPLKVKGTGEGGDVSTLDIAKALNGYSEKQNPALAPGSEPAEMVSRAKQIAEDEAKYQLAQSKTGTEWYTTEMKDHDKVLQSLRPELGEGEVTDAPDAKGHPVNLTLFKAAEAILSSGQKPYANVKSALKAWDAYNETGEFPRINPETGKSWGPRGVNAYGSAFDSLNKLVAEKGQKGAADWLLTEHPVRELRSYQAEGQNPVRGKANDMETGAMILGAKRGPFMQNLHGIESKFTADMWVSRTWNRWMGTLDLDPRIEDKGKVNAQSDAPRNNTERQLMKESFGKTADKLGLSTSSLQAVLWYYEQGLYRAHGIPVESWSFSDAAKRVAKEQPENADQTAFNFGENEKAKAGLAGLVKPKENAVHAFDFLNALKK